MTVTLCSYIHVKGCVNIESTADNMLLSIYIKKVAGIYFSLKRGRLIWEIIM